MPKIKFKKQCPICGRVRPDYEYYKDINNTPLDICKFCCTKDLCDFTKESLTSLLDKLQLPYFPWVLQDCIKSTNVELDYYKERVIGKYIATMKLKTWREIYAKSAI